MNKHMRRLLIVSAAGLLLILGGCGQKQSTKQAASSTSSKKVTTKSSKKTATKTKKTTTTTKSSTKDTALWSTAKASKLASFMQSWGNTMGQQYAAYSQSHPVDFYGVNVPTELSKMPPAIGNAKISYTLSTDGESSADYAVVAIYSDAATSAFADRHLYLFTLHHGQPEVLETMQNQGNENNWLYFNVAQNKELKNGFAKIVAGQPVATSSNTQTTAVDAKTAGILLLTYHNDAWLNEYIGDYLVAGE